MVRGHVRKQPLRTCIECHRSLSKRELVRIVRGGDVTVKVDPTGKIPGRGAYLCRSKQCWSAAIAHRHLGRALKAELTVEDYARIEAYAAQLTEDVSSGA
jgi:uncharacterized protein